jgi:HSP20 family molecular chaperone IbpA
MKVGISELVDGNLVTKSASLNDGILTIDLVRVENSNKVKSYDIV